MNAIVCRDCSRKRPHAARKLCSTCYSRRWSNGTLNEAPLNRTDGNLGDSPLADGLSYRQLDWWTRKGYLQPVDPLPGTGLRRTWPPEERAVARLMHRLVGAGLTPAAAAKAARVGGDVELAPGVRLLVEIEVTQ